MSLFRQTDNWVKTQPAAAEPQRLPQGNHVLRRFYEPTLTTAYATIALFEFLAVTGGALVGIAYHASRNPPTGIAALYVVAAMFVALSEIVISAAFGQFGLLQQQTPHRYLWTGLISVLLTFVLLASLLFLGEFPAAYSRGALLFQLILCSGVVLLFRSAAYARFKSAVAQGLIHGRRIALIGRQMHFEDYARQLPLTGAGVQIIYCQIPPRDRSGRPCITAETIAAALVDQCRILQADDVILLADETREGELSQITASFREIPAAVYAIPRRSLRVWAHAHLAEVAGVIAYRLSRPPLSATGLAVKRGFDLIMSAAALVALSPLMLMVAVAIKLDSDGPVLFAQVRHGYNNQPIRVLKFRTMRVSDDDGFRQATRGDPRITRLGRWLRLTSIDELPQLINILRGDMSIVGPRPHAIPHNEMFAPYIKLFARRHNVKPGLTGWAQVHGYRGETNTLDKMVQRIECDLYYIDHWSLWLDLQIIGLTLFSKKTYSNAG